MQERDRATYIRENLDAVFRTWLRRAALWGCALFLVLSGLDLFATPENFLLFLAYRLVLSAFLLAVYFLVPRISARSAQLVGAAAIIFSAVAIELMILRFRGHESPYSAGMILLGIAVTGFVPASFAFHLAATAGIYLVYLLPLLVTGPLAGHPDFFIANAFMIMIFSTMLLVRYLGWRALKEDLGLRFDLERYRSDLENAVAERTAELAGTIEKLRGEISERRRVEKDRQTLQEQLLQMQKMESIGRLAGGIAHDFNNVLTAILSYAELCLMKLPETHEVYGHITGIRDASEKAARLTRQLLAFSRKQDLAVQPVSLSSVVESMAVMLKRVIGEDIELMLDTTRPVRMVNADAGQMEQVIMNLAVNARDAMPEGGTLHIAVSEAVVDERMVQGQAPFDPGQYALLAVTDSGLGMSRAVRERIFEPFFTTKGEGKGTGLGLATVYGIIKQHKGLIFVDSEPHKGAMFRIYLPIGGEQEMARRRDIPGQLPRGTETVLMVEDDPTIGRLLGDVLASLGYTVLEASSGREALDLGAARADSIDLLLTDVVMPGMSGRQLAERMRGLRPGLRVLYLSGYSEEVLQGQGLLDQGGVLVHKPVTTGALALAVRSALDRPA